MKKPILLLAMTVLTTGIFAQTSVDPGVTPGSTGSVTFTYQGQSTTLTTVRSSDGNIWLRQNLGSTQVGVADNDPLSYGHYFQWGRWDDGHQLPGATIAAATTLSANNPTGLGTGNNNYISSWWSTGTTTDVWSGSTTASASQGKDPCLALGSGWHLPTGAEMAAMYTAENITSAATAFSSNLKLVKAGYKNTGTVASAGSFGLIWSAAPHATTAGQAYAATFAGGPVTAGYWFNRYAGAPCRCTKTAPAPPVGCTGTPSAPTITTTPTTICSGNTISLVGQNSNSTTGITIQWEQSSTGTSGWTNVTGGTGATSLSYTTAALTSTTYFRLKLTCTSSTQSATSAAVMITVSPTIVPTITITTSAPDTICQGTNVTFTATATNGGANPSYQWKKGSLNVGTNAITFSDVTLNSADVITCVITNNETCVSPSVSTSNTISHIVNNTVTPQALIAASPSGSVCLGESISVTATTTNSGSNPTYQWMKGNMLVGTGDNYSFIPENGDAIELILTSSEACANPSVDTSNMIVFTVNDLPVKPTIAINENILTSSAINGNQWYRNNNIIVGANNQTYTATQEGYYQVAVTNENNCSNKSDSSFYDNNTSINSLFKMGDIQLFPSPFNNDLNLVIKSYTLGTRIQIKVSNPLGQIVHSEIISNSENKIKLSHLTSGLYYLTISNEKEQHTFKILKD
jgi:hypothetical protein